MTDIELIDDAIRHIPDFPKPGILFHDITGLLVNPAAFKACVEKMVSLYKDRDIHGICAVESRGFIFAAPLAERLGLPLILIRKKGKLPGETFSCKYALEYGTAEIEVHKSDIQKGKNYIVIDDLIATGGTLNAARTIVEMAGGNVVEFFGIIGLPSLNFKKALEPVPVTTIINYDGE